MTQDQIREALHSVLQMPTLSFSQRSAIARAYAQTFLLEKLRETP